MIKLREQQNRIIKDIEKVLNNKLTMIVEAGTGTGKTLSYLIPVLEYLKNNPNSKVVISTNTINLQEQIIDKDILLASEITGIKVPYKLVKGRNNFVCVMRFDNALKSNDLTVDEKQNLDELVTWFNKTKTGDKSEYKGQILPSLWEKICSSSDHPIPKNSEYYETCFYQKQVEQVNEAQLIISNHSLVLIDLLLKSKKFNGVIPKYEAIIFDEAHHIENVAKNQLSEKVNLKEFNKNSGYLYNFDNNTGYLLKAINEIINHLNEIEIKDIEDNKKEYINYHKNLYKTINSLYKELDSFVIEERHYLFLNILDVNKRKILDKYILIIKDNYISYIKSYNNINKYIEKYEVEDLEIQSFISFQDNLLKQIESIVDILNRAITENTNNLENIAYSYDSYQKTIISFSIDIGNKYNDLITSFVKSVVYMSATLSTNQDFKYFKNNLSIESDIEYIVPSIFNYKEQMTMYGLVNQIDITKRQIALQIAKLNEKHKKILFLFTSYKALMNYKEIFQDLKINILSQTKGISKIELLNSFKKQKQAILLGTDSFWEGIDLAKEQLTCVVIHKLPFLTPSEPEIIKEKMLLDKEGKNYFVLKQIPHVILKMKQGIGRLIRSENDYGDVIIIDDRLISKNYGREILKSLPFGDLHRISLEEINEI